MTQPLRADVLTKHAKSAARTFATVGGFVAFMYGAFLALGFTEKSTGDRLNTLEKDNVEIHSALAKQRANDAVILRRLDGLTTIGCMQLSAHEREIADACHEVKPAAPTTTGAP